MLNDKIKNSSPLMNKVFFCTRVILFALHHNLYFDSHRQSQQFRYIFYRGLYYILCTTESIVNTKNDDQSISRIPKWDFGIAHFLIPDPGIENSILGLQSLHPTVSL